MTIFVCNKCGKFYNSAVLSSCPFCGTPAGPRLEALKYALPEKIGTECTCGYRFVIPPVKIEIYP